MGGVVSSATNVVKSVVGAAVGAVAPKPKAAVVPATAPVAEPVVTKPPVLGSGVPTAVSEAEAAKKRVANSLLQGAGRGIATEEKLGG